MRSIQFRAWDKVLGEMYTDLSDIHFDKNILYSIEYTKDWSSKKGVAGKYIELMQSTGCKDKNDKEIFEGDIAMIFGIPAEIRYSDTWCGWIFFDKNRPIELQELPFYDGEKGNYEECEIIGNIYQNSELL